MSRKQSIVDTMTMPDDMKAPSQGITIYNLSPWRERGNEMMVYHAMPSTLVRMVGWVDDPVSAPRVDPYSRKEFRYDAFIPPKDHFTVTGTYKAALDLIYSKAKAAGVDEVKIVGIRDLPIPCHSPYACR